MRLKTSQVQCLQDNGEPGRGFFVNGEYGRKLGLEIKEMRFWLCTRKKKSTRCCGSTISCVRKEKPFMFQDTRHELKNLNYLDCVNFHTHCYDDLRSLKHSLSRALKHLVTAPQLIAKPIVAAAVKSRSRIYVVSSLEVGCGSPLYSGICRNDSPFISIR